MGFSFGHLVPPMNLRFLVLKLMTYKLRLIGLSLEQKRLATIITLMTK